MAEKCILVVDDEDALRSVIGRALKAEGFSVMLAPGGREALEMIEERMPDLALLDIRMPGLNGFEVLEAIRQKSDIPVIMLSGLGEAETMGDALSAGADDYIKKPFRTRELTARINAKLRRERG